MSRLVLEGLGVRLDELEEMAGVMEVWAYLLILLTSDSNPDKQQKKNGWTFA